MALVGYRDGVLKAKAIQLDQARLKTDLYPWVLGSASVLKTFTAVSTPTIRVGTAIDVPRKVKFVNVLEGASERKVKLTINGYDNLGNAVADTLTLSSAATGQTRSNYAFSYITSIVPVTATKGYGTYSTVALKPTDEFGLTEFCQSSADLLNLQMWGATAGNNHYKGTTTPLRAAFQSSTQSVNLAAFVPVGSTVAITYRSKFQRRR